MKKNYEVAQIVEEEGLGYAIQNYTNGDDFEDQELKEWWQECSRLMDLISDKLGL
jgi:hypothetical protein